VRKPREVCLGAALAGQSGAERSRTVTVPELARSAEQAGAAGVGPQENTVDSFSRVINGLLQILIDLGGLIVAAIVTIELWLRGQLAHLGLPQNAQTVILIAATAILIIAALRLFGGLIRVAVVLVLVIIAIHIFMPLVRY
jgi:hypothetical protein